MHAFHILIVEDNDSLRTFLDMSLRKLSFNNIDHAPNGLEALKLLIANKYDLIFLDNKMPIMTGIDFLLRCKYGDILDWSTVVMITAVADHETIKTIKSESLKVDEFMVKPIDVTVLSSKIDRLLQSAKTNPIQKLIQMSNFVEFKGSFLSINTEVKNDVVTVQMFGFFLNDDRELVKELPDRIANIPQQTIVIDLTNILMIDEFGFGFLLSSL